MRIISYIYDRTGWPDLEWDRHQLAAQLSALRHAQGRLIGRMEALGFPLKQEAILKTLTEDVVRTSEIEGEKLDASQVRSSIARRLGMDVGGVKRVGRDVEGVVEMMLDATRHYDQPLTADRLFAWHASLFPTARSGMKRIKAGAWRPEKSDPMQVVSGPAGRERVHFEAPSAARVPKEMRAFLASVNEDATDNSIDPVLLAGLAHLRFVTIHPFEDGNGRIARAIADWALARSEDSSQRFYSMSAQIQRERDAYYGILERTQNGPLDVTPWLEWFLGCLNRAIEGAQTTLASVLAKARFWQQFGATAINDRQRSIINRLLDGFEGKLTSTKYATLTKCSPDTALRDILQLMESGILVRNAEGGRSTSYALRQLP
jgi:Fic family protein